MLQKIVEKIVEKQLREKVIAEEDRNVYRYGYILVCEVIINIMIAVVIGLIFKDLTAVLLFLGMYIPLRSYCGGRHADKIWKCTVLSNLILFILVVIDEYMSRNCPMAVMTAAFFICLAVILFTAPVETKSKPITKSERGIFRKKIYIILAFHIIVMLILTITEQRKIVFILTYVYMIQTLVLILGLADNRRSVL